MTKVEPGHYREPEPSRLLPPSFGHPRRSALPCCMDIRNVAAIAHVDHGKTPLNEDVLVEATPRSIRVRKKWRRENERRPAGWSLLA